MPLQQQLDSVAQSKPVRKHYWVKPAPWVGNPEFHELDPAELSHLDAGYRLLALFRYWNIINYYFTYRDLLDQDWQQLLVNMIPFFTAAETEPDYFKAVAQLLIPTVILGHLLPLKTQCIVSIYYFLKFVFWISKRWYSPAALMTNIRISCTKYD